MVTFPVPISLSPLFLFVKKYIHVYYTVAINKAVSLFFKLRVFIPYVCGGESGNVSLFGELRRQLARVNSLHTPC